MVVAAVAAVESDRQEQADEISSAPLGKLVGLGRDRLIRAAAVGVGVGEAAEAGEQEPEVVVVVTVMVGVVVITTVEVDAVFVLERSWYQRNACHPYVRGHGRATHTAWVSPR